MSKERKTGITASFLQDLPSHLKPKMTSFAGYELPVSFGSVREEYYAVRRAAGIFNISHMALILLTGEDADSIIEFLDHLTCRKVAGLRKGKVQYNALLNQQGCIIDDITILRLEEACFLLVANASNERIVFEHLQRFRNTGKYFFRLEQLNDHVMLALQGPHSERILRKVDEFRETIENIYYYECIPIKENGRESFGVVSRTGYTGEDGFEFVLSPLDGISLWKRLLEEGVSPCGLAARDILRMEMFYPLYGNELNAQKTPMETNLGWLVDDEKNFSGRLKLLERKNTYNGRTLGFQVLQDGIPRQGYDIISNEKTIGYVTSGGFSFQWNRGFGIGWIETDPDEPITQLTEDKKFFVGIRGVPREIKFFTRSPYKGSLRKRPPEDHV